MSFYLQKLATVARIDFLTSFFLFKNIDFNMENPCPWIWKVTFHHYCKSWFYRTTKLAFSPHLDQSESYWLNVVTVSKAQNIFSLPLPKCFCCLSITTKYIFLTFQWLLGCFDVGLYEALVSSQRVTCSIWLSALPLWGEAAYSTNRETEHCTAKLLG